MSSACQRAAKNKTGPVYISTHAACSLSLFLFPTLPFRYFHAQPAMQFRTEGCCCHTQLAQSLATKLADICHEVCYAIFSLFSFFKYIMHIFFFHFKFLVLCFYACAAGIMILTPSSWSNMQKIAGSLSWFKNYF